MEEKLKGHAIKEPSVTIGKYKNRGKSRLFRIPKNVSRIQTSRHGSTFDAKNISDEFDFNALNTTAMSSSNINVAQLGNETVRWKSTGVNRMFQFLQQYYK